MKQTTLIALLALMAITVKAQTTLIAVTGNPVHYESIIKTDSALKRNQLYSQGLQWFANSFNNGKYVMQVNDENAGVLIGKAELNVLHSPRAGYGNIVSYMIKLSFKDGKVKYELYNFEDIDSGHIIMDGTPTYKGWGKKLDQKFYEQTQKCIVDNCLFLIKSLATSFSNKTSIKNDF